MRIAIFSYKSIAGNERQKHIQKRIDMSLRGFIQMDQVSLVMSLMVWSMVAYIRGRQHLHGVYNVREEWCVIFIVCYVRDSVTDNIRNFSAMSCVFWFLDLYLDRCDHHSDVIRIVTLKTNISTILYFFLYVR